VTLYKVYYHQFAVGTFSLRLCQTYYFIELQKLENNLFGGKAEYMYIG